MGDATVGRIADPFGVGYGAAIDKGIQKIRGEEQPGAPGIATPPPAPSLDNPETQEDLAKARKIARSGKGRASTVLNLGGDSSSASSASRTLRL